MKSGISSETIRIYVVTLVVAIGAFFFSPELRADQNITARSGSGSIGQQDSVVHVLPFPAYGDITPTPANFTAAQVAPYAYIDDPYSTYIQSLPADPTAKWIATGPGLPAGSALFAVPFQVTDGNISSAILDLHYAVDNAVNGVFINGTRISGNSFDGDYHSQYEFVRNDIGPLLIPNSTNWLYINMSDYGGLAGIIFSAAISTTGGNSTAIVPSTGGNTGYVSLDITGQGFSDSDATVVLRAPGQPDITGMAPQVISGTEVIDTFDLTGATPGPRDVIVSQSGAAVATYSNAFTIQSGGSAQLAIDIIGPSAIRGGREGTFYLDVSNTGLVDAPFVLVQAEADNIESTDSTGVSASSTPLTKPNALAQSSLPLCSIDPTTIYVRARAHERIRINCTPKGDGCYIFKGSIQPQEPPDDCAKEESDVARARTALGTADAALGAAQNNLSSIQFEFNLYCKIPMMLSPLCSILTQQKTVAESKVKQLLAEDDQAKRDLASAEAQLQACRAKNSPHARIVEGSKAVGSVSQGTLAALASAGNPIGTSLRFCGVTALDPNGKIGVSGAGQAQYVRGALPLEYTIQFENLPTASAAASQVVMTDVLDLGLDTSTLSLASIRFGSTDLELPPGLPSYSTVVDLTSTLNLLINVSATLTGNIFSLTMTSIDPVTGQPPTDLRGFLPPDFSEPAGEGSVTFTILPKTGLPTGTSITNSASIVFDQNAPIKTSVWKNTMDNTPPASAVDALPSAEGSLSFPVHWFGTDEGAGIQDYTIYVSENGGPFSAWLSNTSATQSIYTGVAGHTYSFYSIARDLAGNMEPQKPLSEASTTVALGPAQVVVKQTLSRDSQNNVLVNLTLANTGGTAAQATLVSFAQIGTVSASTVPSAVDIPAGGSISVLLNFPPSAGPANAPSVLKVGGTYAGGSFNFTSRITLP